MVTNAELIFWCVCGVVAIAATLALIGIANYLEQKDYEKRFDYSDNL